MNAKSYREPLIKEFTRRKLRNPAYSIRAFARDLQVTYSRMNEVMNAKRGLSANLARKIANQLDFKGIEKEIFVNQVEAAHGRSAASRKVAQERLSELKQDADSTIRLDTFELISSWYHYAILELVSVEGFKGNIEWISKRLGLSPIETEAAIERLMRLGLLQKKRNTYIASQAFTLSPTDIPSNGLKSHHHQILKKAGDAIHFQDVSKRDLSSLTLAIHSKDLPKAKALIKEFRRSFMHSMEGVPSKDSVYCLSVQFFRLDQKGDQS